MIEWNIMELHFFVNRERENLFLALILVRQRSHGFHTPPKKMIFWPKQVLSFPKEQYLSESLQTFLYPDVLFYSQPPLVLSSITSAMRQWKV